MIRFDYEKEQAMKFVVNIEGDTQKYAMSFLHIWNNARDNSDVFWKVENTYDSRVYVTFNPAYKAEVKEYLEQFGKILCEMNVLKVNVFIDYDTKDFNTLYPEDSDDTEFFVEVN